MISGTFYGAMAAGLADKEMKENLSREYTAKQVRNTFEAKIREILYGDELDANIKELLYGKDGYHKSPKMLYGDELKDGLHESSGDDDDKKDKKETTAKNLSNFTYLSVLIEKLFDDKTPIYFARDWKLPIQNEDTPNNEDKLAKFRTTWTS